MQPSELILRFVGTSAFIADRDRRVAGLRSEIGFSSVSRWDDVFTSTCFLLKTVDGGYGAQISRSSGSFVRGRLRPADGLLAVTFHSPVQMLYRRSFHSVGEFRLRIVYGRLLFTAAFASHSSNLRISQG